MSQCAPHIADVTKTVYNSHVYEPSDVSLTQLLIRVVSVEISQEKLLTPSVLVHAGQLCLGGCFARTASECCSQITMPVSVDMCSSDCVLLWLNASYSLPAGV